MTKRSNPDTRFEDFISASENARGDKLVTLVRKALSDRYYRLVSKAAQLVADQLLYELEVNLIAAYQRHLDNPTKKDPHCIAKAAIVRALVALDCQDVEFFLAGMRYRQLEPNWGGAVDTAVNLRISSAMGLVGTDYHRAAIEVVELMHDTEPHVRAGAMRAMACVPADRAEPVLRLKALMGDTEPEVTGECFSALLSLNAEETPEFVATYLEDKNADVKHYAALALGESREPEALNALRNAFEQPYVKPDFRRILIRAVTLQRNDAAFDWLLQLLSNTDIVTAQLIVEELGVYRENAKLRQRIEDAVDARMERTLSSTFREHWQ